MPKTLTCTLAYTGPSDYLPDHHNRPGEALIEVDTPADITVLDLIIAVRSEISFPDLFSPEEVTRAILSGLPECTPQSLTTKIEDTAGAWFLFQWEPTDSALD